MSKKKNIILFDMRVNIKEQSLFARIAASKLRAKQVAMVIGNTIHLYGTSAEEFLKQTSWVKHELCHVQQYKRYGFIGFLFRYIRESIIRGYHNNKLEVEARAAEKS